MATFNIKFRNDPTEHTITAAAYEALATGHADNVLGCEEIVFKNAPGEILQHVKAADVQYVKTAV